MRSSSEAMVLGSLLINSVNCALRQALGIALEHGAHDGELVGRHAGVGDAAAEGLVQIEPAAAQQERQPAALGGIHRQRSDSGGAIIRFAVGFGSVRHDITYRYYFLLRCGPKM